MAPLTHHSDSVLKVILNTIIVNAIPASCNYTSIDVSLGDYTVVHTHLTATTNTSSRIAILGTINSKFAQQITFRKSNAKPTSIQLIHYILLK